MLPIVILAGGLATRLRPMTETLPKSLIPIHGEPFIAHQLRGLKKQGIRQVILCLGFLGEQVQDFVQQNRSFGMDIRYSLDGPVLLGTAGAIKKALPLIGESFFVIYGDSYLTCHYGEVQDAFERSGKMALMTVFKNTGKWDESNVEFQQGVIKAYDKKQKNPAMQYIDYGLGLFHRKAYDLVPAHQPYDLAALYQELLRQNQLAAWEVTERFYEIGSREGIHDLSQLLMRRSDNE